MRYPSARRWRDETSSSRSLQTVWTLLMDIFYMATIPPLLSRCLGLPERQTNENTHQRFFIFCSTGCWCVRACMREGEVPPTLTSVTVKTQRKPLRGSKTWWLSRTGIWSTEQQLFKMLSWGVCGHCSVCNSCLYSDGVFTEDSRQCLASAFGKLHTKSLPEVFSDIYTKHHQN